MLNSKIWDLSESCDIIPALRLSYHYLSPNLKRCFSYCSLFPKNYEFHEEEEVTLLWMAEGFPYHIDTKEEIQDLGHKFFHELYSRSSFQQSSSDPCRFLMHDLINDLAQWAVRECYALEWRIHRWITFDKDFPKIFVIYHAFREIWTGLKCLSPSLSSKICKHFYQQQFPMAVVTRHLAFFIDC